MIDVARQLLQSLDAALGRRLAPNGITPTQLLVLRAVGPDAVRMNQIVEATRIDRSTVSDICYRLRQRRIVRCEKSKHDGRAVLVSLTAEGKRCLQRGEKQLSELLQHVDSELTAAELHTLETAMLKIIRLLGHAPSAMVNSRASTTVYKSTAAAE